MSNNHSVVQLLYENSKANTNNTRDGHSPTYLKSNASNETQAFGVEKFYSVDKLSISERRTRTSLEGSHQSSGNDTECNIITSTPKTVTSITTDRNENENEETSETYLCHRVKCDECEGFHYCPRKNIDGMTVNIESSDQSTWNPEISQPSTKRKTNDPNGNSLKKQKPSLSSEVPVVVDPSGFCPITFTNEIFDTRSETEKLEHGSSTDTESEPYQTIFEVKGVGQCKCGHTHLPQKVEFTEMEEAETHNTVESRENVQSNVQVRRKSSRLLPKAQNSQIEHPKPPVHRNVQRNVNKLQQTSDTDPPAGASKDFTASHFKNEWKVSDRRDLGQEKNGNASKKESNTNNTKKSKGKKTTYY